MPFLVRLKPFNEKKGYLVRVYMIEGIRFHEERGWYEVDDALAEKLRELHQDHYDEDSPILFDVCTAKQAEKLDAKAAEVEEVKASARKPAQVARSRSLEATQAGPSTGGDMTSADIKTQPKPAAPEPEEEADDGGDPDEGRHAEIGRVSTGPKARKKQK